MPKTIRLYCPNCDKKVTVGDITIGEGRWWIQVIGRCPKCSGVVSGLVKGDN